MHTVACNQSGMALRLMSPAQAWLDELYLRQGQMLWPNLRPIAEAANFKQFRRLTTPPSLYSECG
jgi:hypothetical protein